MATDWEDYAYHALEELTATEGLKNKYEDLKTACWVLRKTRMASRNRL